MVKGYSRKFHSAAEFEEHAYTQLRTIFPSIERHRVVRVGNSFGLEIDLMARSANGRPVFFELRYVEPGATFPQSGYLSIAALRDHLFAVASTESPILVLLTNGEVTPVLQSTFAKSNIPVVTLGDTVEQTRQRLLDSFQELSIWLPEFQPVTRPFAVVSGLCYVSIPYSASADSAYNRVLAPVLQELGLNIVRWDQTVVDSLTVSRILNTIRVVRLAVIDVSWGNPSAVFEVGLVAGQGKPLVLISESPDIVFPHAGMQVIRYDESAIALGHLRNQFTEAVLQQLRRTL